MWQCSAIITLPCRARIHLFAPLPSQKSLAGSSTSRLNINLDLLNAGTANVFYFIDARTRIGGDVNFAWRRPCRRAGSQRSHAGRWSANVAWSSCSCALHVPVSAERRAELTSHLNPPRRALRLCASAGRAARYLRRSRYDNQVSRGPRTVHAQSRTLGPTHSV